MFELLRAGARVCAYMLGQSGLSSKVYNIMYYWHGRYMAIMTYIE